MIILFLIILGSFLILFLLFIGNNKIELDDESKMIIGMIGIFFSWIAAIICAHYEYVAWACILFFLGIVFGGLWFFLVWAIIEIRNNVIEWLK